MRRQMGFTLIEVMVVVVILGILATLVLPRVINRPDDAAVVKVQSDIQAIGTALELYRLDNFNYPSTSQGLQALITQPNGDPPAKNWKNAYLRSLPKDPWGNLYQYRSPGQFGEFDIWSYGKDGQPDGEGVNSDVGNWTVGT